MKKNVLVTGGSGFIGNNLCEYLVSNNYNVIATTTNLKGKKNSKNLKWVKWHFPKTKTINISWNNVNAIIHAASPNNLFSFPENTNIVFDVFMRGTLYLLNQCLKYNINNFNLISTGGVLGHEKIVAESDNNYNPSNYYFAVKASAEIITKSYGEINTKIIRPFHPYGPKGDKFLINRLINQINNNKVVYIEGENGIELNPIWIEDLVLGIEKSVKHNSSDILHFAGSENITMKDLINKIGEKLNKKPRVKYLDNNKKIEIHRGDFTFTSSLLNWKNKINLDQGIKHYIKNNISNVK